MAHEEVLWKCNWNIKVYHVDDRHGVPTRMIEGDRNTVLWGGISALWQCLIGNGGTGADDVPFFDSGSEIVVGTNGDPTDQEQEDLYEPTGDRAIMDEDFPSHIDTDSDSSGSFIFYQGTFEASYANFVWREIGIRSGSRLLNRIVVNFEKRDWDVAVVEFFIQIG